MALKICSFEGCYTQRFPCSSLAFFQLPSDEPRRTQWILNSGNKQLQNLKANQKRYFCEGHFKKQDIRPHFYRKLLYKHAVPEPYLSDNITTTTTISADGENFEDWDDIEEEVNDTTQRSTDDRNFEDWYELEEEVDNSEEALISDCNQVNGISDAEYGDDGVESLVMSSSEVDILNDETEEYSLLESIKEEEILSVEKVNYANLVATANSEAESIVIDSAPTRTISIGDYHPKSPAATSSAIITSTASSTTKDSTNETISETKNEATTTTLQLINSETEVNNEPSAIDKSYESDKHFALSLVYYFQRLNTRKKAQAKINILSYLEALEQDDEV